MPLPGRTKPLLFVTSITEGDQIRFTAEGSRTLLTLAPCLDALVHLWPQRLLIRLQFLIVDPTESF